MQRRVLRRLVCAVAVSSPVAAVASPAFEQGELECKHIPDHAFEVAELGHAEAQAQLGRLLVEGYCGESTNAYVEGVHWLEAASAQGHVDAAVLVGALLDDGVVFPPDRIRAAKHYGRAAEAGHPAAQHRLGMLLVTGDAGAQDTELGMYWLGAAANHGDAIAAAALGLMHARGLHGVEQDVCLALDWYEASELLDVPFSVQALREELPLAQKDRC
ncbi:MAG: tetratricopeptide repeat protein [Pseudomonadota bacterium]